MRTAQGTAGGQAREARAVRAFPVLSCTLFFAALLAGCNPSSRTPPGSGDPLMGEFVPPKYGTGPAPPRTTKSPGLPPLPAATAVTAPAALAGGDPLVGGKDLAIHGAGGQSDGAWQRPGQRNEAQLSGQTREGAKLLTPTPVATPPEGVRATPGATLTPVATWQGAQGGGSEYDQLQAALRARNVTWQRQETHQDGFKFTCSVPNPERPEFSRVYEATARDYKDAIRAVIEQLDGQRR